MNNNIFIAHMTTLCGLCCSCVVVETTLVLRTLVR